MGGAEVNAGDKVNPLEWTVSSNRLACKERSRCNACSCNKDIIAQQNVLKVASILVRRPHALVRHWTLLKAATGSMSY